jgi:hypothetical protein
MHTLKTTKVVSAAFISFILTACGGGSSSPLDPQTSSGSVSSGSVDTTSPVAIGYGFDSNFAKGVIGVSIGDATLSPGGSTNLTINIVSSTNTLASTPVPITFNSPCIASGEAKLSVNNEALNSNVITSNFGEATLTYTANGCVGADQVTATALIGGRQEVAKATLNIATDTVLTVKALEPSHTQISLKGTGGQETSVVSFLVSGTTGAPVKGVIVDFTLSTESGGASLGGLSLVNNTGTSDKDGMVSTTVQAGNVATSVVVTAKARETNIAATSKKLIVSTGIPDQDSASLSATDPYPSAWDHDGIESTIVIRLADAFNNPVIDGTAVSFTTEGGSVDPSCTTANGTCNVTWRSQNPRPIRDSADNSLIRLLCVNSLGQRLAEPEASICRRERAGRVTLLAHAVGNESFIDNNGNGLYDYGTDTFKSNKDYPSGNPECDKSVPLSSLARPNNSPQQSCDDLVEAYLDRNENGVRDNNEFFVDLNLDGNPSYENGIYNGVLCRDNDPNCTNKEKITIREQIHLVMVSDHMLIEDYSYLYGGQSISEDRFPFLARTVYLDIRPSATSSSASSASSTVVTNETGAYFWLADMNGNGAPAGTTISLDTAGLKNATAALTNPGPLPASPDPTQIGIKFSSGTGNTLPTGFVRVTVTFPTPNGELSISDEVYVNDLNFGH